jgi:hypothetical protein
MPFNSIKKKSNTDLCASSVCIGKSRVTYNELAHQETKQFSRKIISLLKIFIQILCFFCFAMKSLEKTNDKKNFMMLKYQGAKISVDKTHIIFWYLSKLIYRTYRIFLFKRLWISINLPYSLIRNWW